MNSYKSERDGDSAMRSRCLRWKNLLLNDKIISWQNQIPPQ